MDITLSDLDRMMEEKLHQHKEPEVKEVMPSYVPRFNCSSGNCQQVHDNENFSQYPRGKCAGCDQFAKDSEKPCTWCGSNDIDSIDKDDLEDVINYKKKDSGWW